MNQEKEGNTQMTNQRRIASTDKEIDRFVCDLTGKEISIVEEAL